MVKLTRALHFFLVGISILLAPALGWGVVDDRWIDQQTPLEARATGLYSHGRISAQNYKLVFSDEFNKDGREFANGMDARWTALEKPDSSNAPLAYYSESMITTKDGNLVITTTNEEPVSWKGWSDQEQAETTFTRWYKSGMLESWNKFCFTGGVLELDIQLPGPGNLPGLWPAMWLMGNLGRATNLNSTAGLWPWSFNKCVADTSLTEAQRINACSANPGSGLNAFQGRGAPEIDILEAMATDTWSGFTTSLQIAPPLPPEFKPVAGKPPKKGQWYKGLKFGRRSRINSAYYGPSFADAISANVPTDVDFYQQFHTFRLEWVLGNNPSLKWYVDGEFLFEIDARVLQKQYGSLPGKEIPQEPMYLILNTAVSATWSPVCGQIEQPACPPGTTKPCCRVFPAEFLINSVRLYQDPSDSSQTIGCSPPKYPTAQYIKFNPSLYGPELESTYPLLSTGELLLRNICLAVLLLLVLVKLSMEGYRYFSSKIRRWAYQPIESTEDISTQFCESKTTLVMNPDNIDNAGLANADESSSSNVMRRSNRYGLYGVGEYSEVNPDWIPA